MSYELKGAKVIMKIGKGNGDVLIRQSIDPSYRPKDRLLDDENQTQIFVPLAQVRIHFHKRLSIARVLFIALKGFVSLQVPASGRTGNLAETVLPAAAAADRPTQSQTVSVSPSFTAVNAKSFHRILGSLFLVFMFI